MAGITFRNTSGSTYENEIVVEILEIDEPDDNLFDFGIDFPGFSIEWIGDKNNIFDNIITSNAKGSIIINDSNYWFLYNVQNSDEGRYFLRIKKNGVVEFIGKIMLENMTLDDVKEPKFVFTAIDCLTDLKTKRFDYSDSLYPKILDIFTYCLNQLETNWIFPSSGTPLIAFQSDLIPNVGYYSDNLMSVLGVGNYFYTEENSAKVRMFSYDVLLEILKRINCKIIYEIGIFWILGLEGIHTPRIKPLHYYDKNGDFVASDADVLGDQVNVNIDSTALKGGKYYFQKGYKEVRIEADPIFSNRKFGDAVYHNLSFPINLDGALEEIGFAKANTEYTIFYTHDVQEITKIVPGPIIPSFKLKLNLKQVKISDSSVTSLVTDEIHEYPLLISKFTKEYKLNSVAYDRVIKVEWDLITLDTPNNVQYCRILTNSTLTENSAIYDKVVVSSKITDSKNVGIKKIELKGNDYYGNELVKFYFWNGIAANSRQETRDWKKQGDAIYRNLEKVITEEQLKYLGNSTVIEVPHNNINNDFYTTLNKIEYGINLITEDPEIWHISGMTKQIHLDVINLTLIKINNAQNGTITTEQYAPIPLLESPTSNITGNIVLNEKRPIRIYERNLIGNSYTIDYDFDTLWTFESVLQSVVIYINSTKQYLRETSTLSPLHSSEIYLDLDTGIVHFPITYNKAKIEIYITDFFIKAVTA